MPPSVEDFNSMYQRGYTTAFVVCHNGTIYQYVSKELIEKGLYKAYVSNYLKEGYSEKDAQRKALEELKRSHDIDFWEVKP